MTGCSIKPKDHIEDDGIKTITYDEYVNAGIPDALLQGLGFAESLSEEQALDAEDPSDAGKVEKEVPPSSSVVDGSGVNVLPRPNVIGTVVPVLPVSLIQVVGSHVGNTVLPVFGGNTLELTSRNTPSVGSNIISDTPSTVNLVDKDGKILPVVPNLVGNTVSSSLIAGGDDEKGAVRYVDQNGRVLPGDDVKSGPPGVRYVDHNGRVLSGVPFPLPLTGASHQVRMIDSSGRIVTSQVPPNTAVVDKDGRVISGISGHVGIPETNTVSESDAGNFRTSLSASAIGLSSDVKPTTTRRNSTEERSRPNSAYCLVCSF